MNCPDDCRQNPLHDLVAQEDSVGEGMVVDEVEHRLADDAHHPHYKVKGSGSSSAAWRRLGEVVDGSCATRQCRLVACDVSQWMVVDDRKSLDVLASSDGCQHRPYSSIVTPREQCSHSTCNLEETAYGARFVMTMTSLRSSQLCLQGTKDQDCSAEPQRSCLCSDWACMQAARCRGAKTACPFCRRCSSVDGGLAGVARSDLERF